MFSFLKKQKRDEIDYLKLSNGEWLIAQGIFNDTPIFVRINKSLKLIEEDKVYHFRIGIAIPFQFQTETGLLSQVESETYSKIENTIFDYLKVGLKGFVAIVITNNNMREFVIYSKQSNIENLIQQLQKEFVDYEFQYYVEDDSKWTEYKRFNINS